MGVGELGGGGEGITPAKLFPHVFRQGSVPTALTVIICRNCADYLN